MAAAIWELRFGYSGATTVGNTDSELIRYLQSPCAGRRVVLVTGPCQFQECSRSLIRADGVVCRPATKWQYYV
jgi:hypothetical protein